MDKPTFSPPPSTSTSWLTILISLTIGGLAGGLVSAGMLNTKSESVTNSLTAKQSLSVQEDSATVEVVKKASPSVVSIVITKDYSKIFSNQPTSPFDNFFGWPFGQQQVPQGKQEIGGGSGFVVGAGGLIVTNKHVVDDDQADYTVVMNDGKKYDAKVVAKDPTNDVAVVKIDAKDLPTLSLSNSDDVQSGQTVIAIGNALGQYRNTVTKGIISGQARTITAGDSSGQSETLEDVFQTDAAINPGNSGGPLLDLTGRVIAINTAVNSQGQLIGFAIPANVVKRDLDSVAKDGKITRAYLGVRYVLITKTMAEQDKLPVENGALIKPANDNSVAVVPGSPADKAGIVENDIILSVNGADINTDRSLSGLLSKFNPGDTVTLTIYHKGETKEVKVVLEERK
ncbi:MAG: trypsin-like peptidase domain-containing protein [Patescibacteria group bacterium]